MLASSQPGVCLRCINFSNIHAQVKNLGCANHHGAPMGFCTHCYVKMVFPPGVVVMVNPWDPHIICKTFWTPPKNVQKKHNIFLVYKYYISGFFPREQCLFLACSKPRTFYSKPVPKNKAKAKALPSENQKDE